MKSTKEGSEIVSTTRVTVCPENHKELHLTISTLADLIQRDPGCRDFRFYVEDNDQRSFMLVGEWETRADFDNHLSSNHFAVLLGSLRLLSTDASFDFR